MAIPNRIAPRRDLKERRSTMIGAAVAAGLAAVLFAVALGHSNGNKQAGAPASASTSVVVASKHLHRGTLISAGTLSSVLEIKNVPTASVTSGAITTLDDAKGKVLSADVASGRQLTAAVLSEDSGAISTRLTGDERAVTLPIDKLHGMTGDIAAGDQVDIYASFNLQTAKSSRPIPTVRLLAQNATVLHAPEANSGGTDGANAQVSLSVPSQIAEQLAFTADYGKVWIAARPASGASTQPPSVVTVDGVLYGGSPITITTDGKIR
jgi:Flp pilus assembly protein CpaB